MKWLVRIAVACSLCGAIFAWSLAQDRGFGRPPMRRHTINSSPGQLRLVPAVAPPQTRNEVSITIEGDQRVIRANGVPEHATGNFPNRGNPHQIIPQNYVYRVPAKPARAASTTALGMHNFGIAVNGVPFDPGAAEWYLGNPRSGWQYEPLSGAISLGIDVSHAHVQPTGAYHYHGLPTGLLDTIRLSPRAHSPLIGWAADGSPMYAVYGFDDAKDPDSAIRAIKSSYRLKSGGRPAGNGQPGGNHDGTFTADYEYVEGLGDLDECNGRFTITPEFPDGIYAYFLTEDWPVIPRQYRGTPSPDFVRRGPGGPGGRPGPPGRFGPPGRGPRFE